MSTDEKNAIIPDQHILLTALGRQARETPYALEGRTQSAPFASLALVQLLPPRERPDRVLALVTQGAREKTWRPFARSIEEVLAISAEPIAIPDGRTPAEIRQILEQVAERIPENVKLTLDVTQGYRHFPFLFYALALYLQSLRGVSIRGVYYGMVEGVAVPPCPILDLRPLLELPGWFHAVQIFRDAGVTAPMAQMARPLAERLRQQAEAAGHDRRLHQSAGAVEHFVRDLECLSAAYESGLPLELGRAATGSATERFSLPAALVESLPLAAGLEEMLAKAVAPHCFAEAPEGGKNWKKHIVLDAAELERQANLIDAYLDRNQQALAIGLMREWVVSWVLWKKGRESSWLNKKDRKEAEERLGALAQYVEREKEVVPEQQRLWGEFWNQLSTLRNRFHHHGMSEENLPGTQDKIISFWRAIRAGRIDLPPLGGGGGRLLLSPQGHRSGVLFSALRASQPRRCLAICSQESRPSVAAAARQAGFSGDLEIAELADPFAGYDERQAIVARARRLLLEADEVVANLTGGTTVMGIVVQALIDEARVFDRPCRRLVLVDRRTAAEQEAEPYVESESLWLDGEGDK